MARTYFEEIFYALNKRRVRYLVVGGVAMNLYGIERMTADLDLIVDLEERNLRRFITVMNNLDYKPKVPVKAEDFISKVKREQWLREKNMKVFSFYNREIPYRLVDVFVEIPFNFSAVYEHRKKIKIQSTTIFLIDIENLIRLKSISGRPQDLADIHHLEMIRDEKE